MNDEQTLLALAEPCASSLELAREVALQAETMSPEGWEAFREKAMSLGPYGPLRVWMALGRLGIAMPVMATIAPHLGDLVIVCVNAALGRTL